MNIYTFSNLLNYNLNFKFFHRQKNFHYGLKIKGICFKMLNNSPKAYKANKKTRLFPFFRENNVAFKGFL